MLLLLASCEGYETNEADEKLVLEGWIESGGYPVVLLTMTAAPDIAEDINLADYIAKYAKVTLCDGDTTIVLTGMIDKNYYPPVVFKSFKMRGKPGREYILTATYEGRTVRACTKIAEPYSIKQVSQVSTGDTTRVLDVEIEENIPAGEKIMFFTRIWHQETRYYPSLLGIYESTGEYPRKYSVFHEIKSTDFVRGDSVSVKLYHLDDFQFKFWQAYFNAVNFGGGFVISTDKSLPTNVEGGYGYFFGYGSSKASIILE